MPEKLRDVSSKYGAPMGRSDNRTELEFSVRFHLRRMRWVSGDYDEGGAYWGRSMGAADMWHAWGDASEEEQEMFLRAWTREEAKRAIQDRFPNATFYR